MDLKLKNKRIFISGSTSGIGYATAKCLLKEGATIILNGRTESSVTDAVKRLQSEFPRHNISGVPANFQNKDEVKMICNTVNEVDILINNVGVYKAASFFEMDDEEWLKQFTINVMSGVRLSRHFMPKMLENNWGRIIFISSECAALVPPDMLAYSMTKTAIISIAKGLAQLTKATGVTVNTVLPGSTLTEGAKIFLENEALKSEKSKEAIAANFFKDVRTSSLLQRFATVDEVATTISYYCSPLSAVTNGAVIKVDGGSTAGIF